MIFTTQWKACVISNCFSLNYTQKFLTECRPGSIGTDLPIVVGTSPVECPSSSELDERYAFTQNGLKNMYRTLYI